MVSAQAIDALLPQTQCGECGYPGCLPYAQALSAGLAPIDRCPPGGVNTVLALAKLLDKDATPYLETAREQTRPPATAMIRESECIGCTKCIQACPVDAILGSAKHMHTILRHECTGCGLCVDPCPVDCIDVVTLPAPLYDPARARQRFQAREVRQLRDLQAAQQQHRAQRQGAVQQDDHDAQRVAKQDYILQALQRVSLKKGHVNDTPHTDDL